VEGNGSAPASILYADITSPIFGQFHKTLIESARKGKTSYRVRHRRPLSLKSTPLIISGYGVELALKRTDYIVIDDRNTEEAKMGDELQTELKLEDQDVADLKPLSASELASLSLKVSSFIMRSENPFQTLIKISQDFPRYSTAMAARNTSVEFLTEHQYNRGQLLPAGRNVLWINGVQIIERQVDAFTLLDIIRREKKFVNAVRELGLTASEAVSLLSNPKVASVKAEDEPQRFDWRDKDEGENVIVWLNDIEKDKRYGLWPSDLNAVSTI
jgi:UDP-glucose:glycoprotein glucosyltransferase